MPLLSARWLASLPVKYGHQSVGRSVRVWFDLNTGQGLGLFVTSGQSTRFLSRPDARLEEHSIAISQKTCLTTVTKPSRASVVSQIDRHLIGAAVETEDGRRVGILKDLLLTEYDWRIMQLVVSEKDGDRLLTRDVIVALADNLITVQNDVLNALTSSWISPPSMELIH